MQSIKFAVMRYIISFSMEMACSEVQTGNLTGLNCQIFTNKNANVTKDLDVNFDVTFNFANVMNTSLMYKITF